MKILDAAYNAIKRRHNNIPQETLPLELVEITVTAKAKTDAKQRGPRSIRFAVCPSCRADRPTGVIRMSDGSEVFRDHNKVLHGGARVPCSGSAKVAPEAAS